MKFELNIPCKSACLLLYFSLEKLMLRIFEQLVFIDREGRIGDLVHLMMNHSLDEVQHALGRGQ